MTLTTTIRSTTKLTPSERTMVTDQVFSVNTNIPYGEEMTQQTSPINDFEKSLIPLNVRPKKAQRKQKSKELVMNRTDIEDDRNQRRRKNHHHHRRNNTLLTNSVHDEIPVVNISENPTTTSGLQNSTHESHQRQNKLTTVIIEPTTITSNKIAEILDSDKDGERISEQTSPQTEASMTTESINTSQTSDYITSNTILTEVPNMKSSTNLSTTTLDLSSKKSTKLPKNKSTGVLGPARIDVTILEPPDRKHKQGNFI